MSKPIRIGINGFGRIGRCTLKQFLDRGDPADIEVVEIDGVDVLVVSIPESRTKPHYLLPRTPDESVRGSARREKKKGKKQEEEPPRPVYIRQGDRSVIASREVERVLAADHPDAPPLTLHIGKIERALFDYLEKNRRITLREFRHQVNISERRASRVMVRLVRAGLVRIFTDEAEDYYTLA